VIRASLAAWAFAAAGVVQAAVVVPLEVDMSAEVAAGRFEATQDQVGIRGSEPPLSWEKPILLQPRGNGRWGAELRFDSVPFGGRPVQYKFRIEKPGQSPDANWEPGPNRLLALDTPAPRVARVFGAPPDGLALRRTGNIERLGRIASLHVTPREVQVWLPPGYEREPARRYPVLYLHDGQNVFDAQAAGSEWQVDEAAQRGVTSGRLRPFIVVALSSKDATRTDDYTPTTMTLSAERLGQKEAQRRGGGVSAYARFLVEELKPAIDARYRTRPGRADTAVGGSSFGGLASMWLALHRPETFGAALVVSPSVWWDDGYLLRDVAATAPSPRPRLWVDMGAQEGEQAMKLARELVASLRKRGWSADGLQFVEDAQGRHDEASWARRVPAMLDFLYRADAQ